MEAHDMESSEIMVWALFPLIIYIICAMPTKSDLRRAVGRVGEAAGPGSWRASLEQRKGASCTLMLDEAMSVAKGIEVSGMILDVDDEWVLMETVDKKAGVRHVALRLELIRSIEEEPSR